MNPLLQALGDKPSSRQSFLYTGPSTDLDALQQHAPGAAPGLHRPPDGHQRRTTEENGGGPPRGDGPKMVSHIHVCMHVACPHVATCLWSCGHMHVTCVIASHACTCHMLITCMSYAQMSHACHMLKCHMHVICSNVTCMSYAQMSHACHMLKCHMHVICSNVTCMSCSNVTCTYTYTLATSMSHVVLYMCRVPRSASTSASLAERSFVELCGG